MSGEIAGYIATRFGAEVGTGPTREAASIDAWNNGMRSEVEIEPTDRRGLERARERLECRTWQSEL